MNDLLSSGDIPGLFPVEDMDDIINNVRPLVKRAGLADTRDNCWDMFIEAVRTNLHVILCFSPIGDPIKIRTRRFPALVNCVVIDWFQPWPEEALTDVARHFMGSFAIEDENAETVRSALINHMGKVHKMVDDSTQLFFERFRRRTYVTPRSYLGFIELYREVYVKKVEHVQELATSINSCGSCFLSAEQRTAVD